MARIGLGVAPTLAGLYRPKVALRVPLGRAALADGGRYLTDSNGAVLLGDSR